MAGTVSLLPASASCKLSPRRTAPAHAVDLFEHREAFSDRVKRRLLKCAKDRWVNSPHQRLAWPVHKAESQPSPRWANLPTDRLRWPFHKEHDVEQTLESRLANAIAAGSVNEVERLIREGAPLCAQYKVMEEDAFDCTGSALDLAMLNRRFLLSRKLIAGVGPEKNDELVRESTCAVVLAAREGRSDILEELLSRGALAGQCDRAGRSALFLAALRGHSSCVRILLHGGALNMDPMKATAHEWLSHYFALPGFAEHA